MHPTWIAMNRVQNAFPMVSPGTPFHPHPCHQFPFNHNQGGNNFPMTAPPTVHYPHHIFIPSTPQLQLPLLHPNATAQHNDIIELVINPRIHQTQNHHVKEGCSISPTFDLANDFAATQFEAEEQHEQETLPPHDQTVKPPSHKVAHVGHKHRRITIAYEFYAVENVPTMSKWGGRNGVIARIRRRLKSRSDPGAAFAMYSSLS
eukprot:CAMPEP_0183319286 /NCGR_PEP_ID=MMETSP0160_2-20130417/63113_1 /TAXON_ID=2839 ORGANISM="Odontella Sinensis, Strain Grunow 1884" /NCGR_SAMPLE_ID=MMETSP0160_2 /ASSEMBLY_ACC=CAM_ASM_000250 /LENGTH=203 /DNA_ID=CAMNT_0025485735 /DNA_START=195 /DNA_END=802 /DNA_ORIENTATION=-